MSGRLQAAAAVLRRAQRSTVHFLQARLTSMRAARRQRADARALAICPVDDWSFRPLYTDGVCPLCGWKPPGYVLHPPLLHRLDWYYAAILAIAAVSLLMLLLVLNAFVGA